MSLIAACEHRKAPVRLTFTTALHCSKVKSSSGNRRPAHAGIVEENVQPSENFLRLREQRGHGFRHSYIGGHNQHAATRRSRHARGDLELGFSAAGQDHRITGFVQPESDAASDTATGASD